MKDIYNRTRISEYKTSLDAIIEQAIREVHEKEEKQIITVAREFIPGSDEYIRETMFYWASELDRLSKENAMLKEDVESRTRAYNRILDANSRHVDMLAQIRRIIGD